MRCHVNTFLSYEQSLIELLLDFPAEQHQVIVFVVGWDDFEDGNNVVCVELG